MLCLPVLADTAWISQLAEITQFIFGRPLRDVQCETKLTCLPEAGRLVSQYAGSEGLYRKATNTDRHGAALRQSEGLPGALRRDQRQQPTDQPVRRRAG